jgi:phosphoribosylformimino-5-aminoimidazole carboxamide ribotide isomerase
MAALREMQRAMMQNVEEKQTCSLIASGGVSSMDDLRALAELGVEGAIVGKAIYTGNLDLARAIEELERSLC